MATFIRRFHGRVSNLSSYLSHPTQKRYFKAQTMSSNSAVQRSRVILAPAPIPASTGPTIFLSGSVDAPPASWRNELSQALSHLPVTILNPERPDWDSSWEEDISFEPFREQTNWEMDAMERADIIAVYFGAAAKAPIALLELGLFARRGKDRIVVSCPEGYWKRGNVQVVCQRFGIEMVAGVNEMAAVIARQLKAFGIDGNSEVENSSAA